MIYIVAVITALLATAVGSNWATDEEARLRKLAADGLVATFELSTRQKAASMVSLFWLLGSLGFGCALALSGFSYFVSDVCIRTMLWPFAVLNLMCCACYYWITPIVQLRQSRRVDLLRPISGFKFYVLLPMVLVGISYFSFLGGLAYLLHPLGAEPFTLDSTILKIQHEGGSSRQCIRAYVSELDDYHYGRLCISDRASGRLRPGDHLTLTGTKSWFGVHFDRYSYRITARTAG